MAVLSWVPPGPHLRAGEGRTIHDGSALIKKLYHGFQGLLLMVCQTGGPPVGRRHVARGSRRARLHASGR